MVSENSEPFKTFDKRVRILSKRLRTLFSIVYFLSPILANFESFNSSRASDINIFASEGNTLALLPLTRIYTENRYFFSGFLSCLAFLISSLIIKRPSTFILKGGLDISNIKFCIMVSILLGKISK
uniref:ORF17 n=1 Tax=Physarum polycephalum TaxID=5791 RepID=Q9MJ65_PHYPO|nr:hypothetical protein PhpooMp18 [Physarum polycephalum]BAB08097.1 unnamed protein product [Physarum polycephalum]